MARTEKGYLNVKECERIGRLCKRVLKPFHPVAKTKLSKAARLKRIAYVLGELSAEEL